MDAESSSDESGRWCALPVPRGEPCDSDDAEAQSYLQQVRRQARALPSVIVAPAGKATSRNTDGAAAVAAAAASVATGPGGAAPLSAALRLAAVAAAPPASAAWRARVRAEFESARDALAARSRQHGAVAAAATAVAAASLPASPDVKDWLVTCFGWVDTGSGPVALCARPAASGAAAAAEKAAEAAAAVRWPTEATSGAASGVSCAPPPVDAAQQNAQPLLAEAASTATAPRWVKRPRQGPAAPDAYVSDEDEAAWAALGGAADEDAGDAEDYEHADFDAAEAATADADTAAAAGPSARSRSHRAPRSRGSPR